MDEKDNITPSTLPGCQDAGLMPVETLIYTIRCQQVMLDSDLARLYGVETRRLNEQVK